MNYGEFKTQLAQYLHRGDLTSLLPTFIEYGRLRLFETLRTPEMVERATVTLTDGEGALSTDLVEVIAVLRATGSNFLPLVQAAHWEVRSYSQGVFAVQGDTLICPGLDEVEVIYCERPLTLIGAADSATRDVLEAYPYLWLQAALAEGLAYLQDTEAEAACRARLEDEVTRANSRTYGQVYGPHLASSDSYAGALCAGPGL